MQQISPVRRVTEGKFEEGSERISIGKNLYNYARYIHGFILKLVMLKISILIDSYR